uniref:Ribosomal protein S11 n=1 Tax=Corallina chilensis TaxID=2582857 RepID=A0A4V1FUN1_9FLOR|nr:ribosomal protein S11 [Corallina chilensis]QCS25451.1 ribosomal protein S11 [Corallina chilensis]
MQLPNKNLSILFIFFKNNNIICTLTNANGAPLNWATVGTNKMRGTKKITTSSIINTIKLLYNYSIRMNSTSIHLKIKGTNKSKLFFIKSLKTIGFIILSIQENLIIPHNGCKKIRTRRI